MLCVSSAAFPLLHKKGCMSMIVPLSLPSTQRMRLIQQLLETARNAWYANYAWRPAKLFDTVNRALTIFVVGPADNGCTFATNYQKWTSDNRDGLFHRPNYVEVPRTRPAFWVPKLEYPLNSPFSTNVFRLKLPQKTLGVIRAACLLPNNRWPLLEGIHRLSTRFQTEWEKRE